MQLRQKRVRMPRRSRVQKRLRWRRHPQKQTVRGAERKPLSQLTFYVFSPALVFDTLRFFSMVSPIDFLFGLDWSPMAAIREDQQGQEGSFGFLPVLLGTSVIAILAMFVAGIRYFSGWIVFALLIVFALGTKHPRPLTFESSLGSGRRLLLLIAILIFVTCFMLEPIRIDLG